MKTTSRKRLLISSVAMLLVAMLALGTATFAWFTSNTSATADSINVKTIKASDLQVASSKLTDWGTKLHYNNTNNVLIPASSADGTKWFTATAAEKNKKDRKGNFEPVDITAPNNTYVFSEALNIRNNGEADVKDVTIAFTMNEAAAGGKYARVAVVPVASNNANPAAGKFDEASTDGTAKYIFDTDGIAYNPASAINAEGTEIKPNTTCSVSVGDLAGKKVVNGATTYDVRYYKIYVWFEGQDADCFADNAGNELPQLSFSITGNTDSQV